MSLVTAASFPRQRRRTAEGKTEIMEILPMNFKIFKLFGLWSEVGPGYWDFSMVLRRVLAVGLVFHFTITQGIELILNGGGVESLTEQLFLTTTFLSMSCKIINFSFRRGQISNLLSCFREDLLKFENLDEKEKILKKCDSRCRRIFLAIMCLSQVTCFALLLKPFLVAGNENAPLLPFKTYQLCDTSSAIPYAASYVVQASSVIASVFLNVSCDTLVYGFILQTSAQLDILSLRLAEILDRCGGKMVAGTNDGPKEAQRPLGSCVEHHVLVRNLVRKIETLFAGVISIQFASSLNTLCTTVYQISKVRYVEALDNIYKILTLLPSFNQQDLPSVQFFVLQLYLSCMLSQTFFYCFYGNELRAKSRTIGDTVYKSDWIQFSPKKKKSLKLIILMSQRELSVSCNGIFILSLSTFMWIIKTSYSAFNLLQQISN